MKSEKPRKGEEQPSGAPSRRYVGLIASAPERKRGAAARAGTVSVVFHGLLIGGLVWVSLKVSTEVAKPQQITMVDLVNQVVPAPPKPAPPPKVHIAAPKGFQTLLNPNQISASIPPPSMAYSHFNPNDFSGKGVAGGRANGDSTAAAFTPPFTPYTVAPSVVNGAEVERALARDYPPLLRDASLGGTVDVWIHISDKGVVGEVKVHKSSGYPALDSAAVQVGHVIKFRPALNRDQKVPVWVSIPITFQVNH